MGELNGSGNRRWLFDADSCAVVDLSSPVITLAVVVGIPALPGSAATATAGPGATGNSAFGKIVNTMDANVDAVVPGHTMPRSWCPRCPGQDTAARRQWPGHGDTTEVQSRHPSAPRRLGQCTTRGPRVVPVSGARVLTASITPDVS